MATWKDLTPEQQEIYLAFEGILRPTTGQFARVLRVIQDPLKIDFDARIWPMIQPLTGTLGTNTGLAGAQLLTPDDLNVLCNKLFEAALLNNDKDSRELYIKVAGPGNV